jgi:peroxin-11B
MKTQFGLTRKIMRFGKNIEHFKAAAVAADAKGMDPVLKYLAVGRQLGYAMYLSIDAITCIDAVGIRKFAAAKRLQQEAYKAWFVGLLCNALAGVYTLYKLREKEQGLDKKEGEGVVEGKKIERYGRLVLIEVIEILTRLL